MISPASQSSNTGNLSVLASTAQILSGKVCEICSQIRAVSSLDSRLRKHNGFMTKLEVQLSLGRGLEVVSGLDIQVDRSIIIILWEA